MEFHLEAFEGSELSYQVEVIDLSAWNSVKNNVPHNPEFLQMQLDTPVF